MTNIISSTDKSIKNKPITLEPELNKGKLPTSRTEDDQTIGKSETLVQIKRPLSYLPDKDIQELSPHEIHKLNPIINQILQEFPLTTTLEALSPYEDITLVMSSTEIEHSMWEALNEALDSLVILSDSTITQKQNLTLFKSKLSAEYAAWSGKNRLKTQEAVSAANKLKQKEDAEAAHKVTKKHFWQKLIKIVVVVAVRAALAAATGGASEEVSRAARILIKVLQVARFATRGMALASTIGATEDYAKLQKINAAINSGDYAKALQMAQSKPSPLLALVGNLLMLASGVGALKEIFASGEQVVAKSVMKTIKKAAWASTTIISLANASLKTSANLAAIAGQFGAGEKATKYGEKYEGGMAGMIIKALNESIDKDYPGEENKKLRSWLKPLTSSLISIAFMAGDIAVGIKASQPIMARAAKLKAEALSVRDTVDSAEKELKQAKIGGHQELIALKTNEVDELKKLSKETLALAKNALPNKAVRMLIYTNAKTTAAQVWLGLDEYSMQAFLDKLTYEATILSEKGDSIISKAKVNSDTALQASKKYKDEAVDLLSEVENIYTQMDNLFMSIEAS